MLHCSEMSDELTFRNAKELGARPPSVPATPNDRRSVATRFTPRLLKGRRQCGEQMSRLLR